MDDQGKPSDFKDSFNPMEMCRKMMARMGGEPGAETSFGSLVTKEVQQLFSEWATQIEEEIVEQLKADENLQIGDLAGHLKISKESVIYFVALLAQRGKIELSIKLR